MLLSMNTLIWIGLGFLGLIIFCLAMLYISVAKLYKLDAETEEELEWLQAYVDDQWSDFFREFDPQDFVTEMDVDQQIERVERDIRQEFESDIADIDNIRDALHMIGEHIKVALDEKHEVRGTAAKIGERFRNI